MYHYLSVTDLAGDVCFNPTLIQTKTRIHNLIATYLTSELLSDRIKDLPEQFLNPQPRPWQPIEWQSINSEQILGIDLKLFLKIIKGALETEAPIRGYTQTSRQGVQAPPVQGGVSPSQYLQTIHPAMARFVGGVVAADNSVLELGLWEKEERQHSPALAKVYQQLTAQKVIFNSPRPKIYHPSGNAKRDLFRHGIHRIATEYSAVCLYLWMMARTTDHLQQVLKELLQDEINHMTKFWGFGKWLYTDFNGQFFSNTNNHYSYRNLNCAHAANHLRATVVRMMRVLDWESWSLTHKIELLYTFVCVGQRMQSWNNSLSSDYLKVLFASSLISENNLFEPSSINM